MTTDQNTELFQKLTLELVGDHLCNGQRRRGTRRRCVSAMKNVFADFADAVIENEVLDEISVRV